MIHFAVCESKITDLFFLSLLFSIQFSFTFRQAYYVLCTIQSKILDRYTFCRGEVICHCMATFVICLCF